MDIYSNVYIRGTDESKRVKITSDLKPDVHDMYISNWQELLDTATKIANVPTGLIMKLNENTIEVFVKSNTEGNPYKEGESAELVCGLYCETVIGTQQKLMVPDARKSPVWSVNNPDVDLNMVSYLGHPINWPDGEIFGTVCLLDSKENYYSEDLSDFLKHLKQYIETDLKLMCQNSLLEEKKTELEKLNNTKTRFLSLISHDLRGNMGMLHSFLKFINDSFDTIDRLELEKSLKLLERSAGAAFTTLESLLIWSKNDLVELAPDFKQVDIVAVIKELTEFFMDLIDLKLIKVVKDFCAESVFIEADENMLKTSLRNILSNAIKYSNDNGSIRIRVYMAGSIPVVEIEDSGVGMNETTLKNLFNYKEVQGKNERYSAHGARIGLMLVKEFLDKNNAVVKVESKQGEGTKFIVFFNKR